MFLFVLLTDFFCSSSIMCRYTASCFLIPSIFSGLYFLVCSNFLFSPLIVTWTDVLLCFDCVLCVIVSVMFSRLVSAFSALPTNISDVFYPFFASLMSPVANVAVRAGLVL